MTPWRDPLPDPRPGTFWAGLAPADRAALVLAGTVRAVPRGTLLHREGSRPAQVRVLLSGRVEVFRDDQAGRRTVLAIHTAGEILGELSAVDGLPVSASAVATGPASVLEVTADRFAALCRERPGLAWALISALVRRLRLTNEGRIRQRADVLDRTVLALLDLTGGRPGPVPVLVTQQQLADVVSAALISVTRALDELRDLGLVTTTRGRITVLDPEALRLLLH